ncbi:MAG: hypothetical protein RL318_462 [Fibrobacterota bacterium]|jgi:peptidoglycan/LPS O-acetylase OafA/YrhL
MGLIRFLLALSVLLEHAGPANGFVMVGGELAVQAFYVISGFYMAMILQDRYAGRLRQFYRNRFLRLFPMYWTILGITIGLSALLWLSSGGTRAGLLGAWLTHGGDLGVGPLLLLGFSIPFLFLQDAVLFMAAQVGTGALLPVADFRAAALPLHPFLPIAPSWSLSLELCFYLLCPWIARLRIGWIAGLAALSLGLKGWLALKGLDFDPWSYRFFPTSLGYFLVGMLAWNLGRRFKLDLPKPVPVLAWGLVLGLLVFWRIGPEPRSLGFVAVLAISLPSLFRLTKDWTWDRWIGDLSFPLYLSHWLVLAIALRAPVSLRIALAILVAIALQLTVGRWVERRRTR